MSQVSFNFVVDDMRTLLLVTSCIDLYASITFQKAMHQRIYMYNAQFIASHVAIASKEVKSTIVVVDF